MKNLYLSTKNRLPYGIAMILLTFGLIAFKATNSFAYPAKATWVLTSNNTVTTQGNITASIMVAGTGLNSLSYSSNGVQSKGWTSNTSLDPNDYYQYSITSQTGNILTIDKISFEHFRENNSGTVAVYYSTSPDFSNSIQIENNLPTPSAHTTVNLSTSIVVDEGQTLYLRIYAFEIRNGQQNYYNRNVIISGTTCLKGTWLGVNSDWNTPANWCGGVPTPTTDVLIPAGLANYPVIAAGASADCKNLTIESGASLTIESTETASGSLIATGTSTGTVTYNRWLQAIYYQLISSPVNPSGWNNPNNIYSFITYNEATDKWTAQDPVPSVLENGRGYGMVADVAGTVNFTGSLNNGDVTIALDKTEVNQFIYGWNLVGNPYTSALLIKSESALATTFLSENAPDEGLGNIDASFQAVYVYDQTDYKVIGKAGFYPSQETALEQNLVQAGQAFFVKAAYQDANLVFKREMQAHGPAVALKSGHKSWPGVQLNVSTGDSHHYTMVTYQGDMTPGLDPGYDAGLFSTGGEIELFTRLVNDNGVRFMIQAVPDYDFEQNAVPVGVNFAKGGEVTFSGFVVPLDGNYKIYLEDRLTGVLTDLSQDEYTVTLAANTKGTGRFFIVAAQTTGIETPGEISDNLMVWASDRKIHIRGELSGKATARLLDLNGRLIMETSLPDTRNNLVQTPVQTGGIYLLQVLDGNRQTTRKVVIN